MRVHVMARALDVSPYTVRRMIADGEIDGAVKLRGRWVVPRDVWEAFLRSIYRAT